MFSRFPRKRNFVKFCQNRRKKIPNSTNWKTVFLHCKEGREILKRTCQEYWYVFPYLKIFVFPSILTVGTPGLCGDSVMILIYNIKNHKEHLMAGTVCSDSIVQCTIVHSLCCSCMGSIGGRERCLQRSANIYNRLTRCDPLSVDLWQPQWLTNYIDTKPNVVV